MQPAKNPNFFRFVKLHEGVGCPMTRELINRVAGTMEKLQAVGRSFVRRGEKKSAMVVDDFCDELQAMLMQFMEEANEQHDCGEAPPNPESN